MKHILDGGGHWQNLVNTIETLFDHKLLLLLLLLGINYNQQEDIPSMPAFTTPQSSRSF